MGDYASVCRLLQLRLRAHRYPNPVASTALPSTLLAAARRAGFDYAQMEGGDLVLGAAGVFALLENPVELSADRQRAQALMRWLGWQFDDIATQQWAAREVERKLRDKALTGSSLFLQVDCAEGKTCWRFSPVTDGDAMEAFGDLLVSEECSLALLDSELCVVVDQDFLCVVSGDDRNESKEDVLERLNRALLPRLELLLSTSPGAKVGVGSGEHLRRARPTVLVAVPVREATPELVREAVGTVLDFAFPP